MAFASVVASDVHVENAVANVVIIYGVRGWRWWSLILIVGVLTIVIVEVGMSEPLVHCDGRRRNFRGSGGGGGGGCCGSCFGCCSGGRGLAIIIVEMGIFVRGGMIEMALF